MVGKLIKDYLTENGIKQSFLSEKSDIPEPVLSKMFAGQRRITVEEYSAICKSLKVPMDFFVEG